MMCKVYYAASVNSIMPRIIGVARLVLFFMSLIAAFCERFTFRICLTAIAIWHYSLCTLLQGFYAETPQNRLERSCTQTRRGAQPSSGIDLGSAVQGKCFLRSERPGASTLRNVAPPSHRRLINCCRGRGLWCFAAYFLSGANRIHQGRSPRVATKTSRPQTWTQIVRRGDRLRSRDQKISAGTHHRGMPADDQRAIRHHYSPPQSRAGAGTEKKRREIGPLQLPPLKSAEAYEVLRSQALHPEDYQN